MCVIQSVFLEEEFVQNMHHIKNGSEGIYWYQR